MIKASSRLSLLQYGVKLSDLTWYAISINANDYIMCLVKEEKSKSVIVINLNSKEKIIYETSADSIKMNYFKNILALKNNSTVQVIGIGEKKNIIALNMPFEVEYWNWVGENILAFICKDNIYYFDIYKSNRPFISIARNDILKGYIIVDHDYNEATNYSFIVALKQDINIVYGKILLTNQKITQYFDGTAGCFFKYKRTDLSSFDTFFAYINKNTTGCYIKILQLNNDVNKNIIEEICQINVSFSLIDLKSSDIPKALYFCEILGIFYIVTREAKVIVYHYDKKKEIGRKELTRKLVITSYFNRKNNAIMVFLNDGYLYSFQIENVLPFLVSCRDVDYKTISSVFKNSLNLNPPSSTESVELKFEKLIDSKNYIDAGRVAGNDRSDKLRNINVMKRLLNFKSIDNVSECFEIYMKCLMNRSSLNHHETQLWIQYLICTENKFLIDDCIKKEKIEFTDDIGNDLLPYYPDLAIKVFANAGSFMTIVEYLLYINDENELKKFMTNYNLNSMFMDMFNSLLQSNPESALKFTFFLIDEYSESSKFELLDIITNTLVQNSYFDQAVQCLLGNLKNDSQRESNLQNKLIVLCLKYYPTIAENIFKSQKYTFYDKATIANICKRMGLPHLALWNVEKIDEICDLLQQIKYRDDEIFDYLSHAPSEIIISCIKRLAESKESYMVAEIIVNRYYQMTGDERFYKLIGISKNTEPTYGSDLESKNITNNGYCEKLYPPLEKDCFNNNSTSISDQIRHVRLSKNNLPNFNSQTKPNFNSFSSNISTNSSPMVSHFPVDETLKNISGKMNDDVKKISNCDNDELNDTKDYCNDKNNTTKYEQNEEKESMNEIERNNSTSNDNCLLKDKITIEVQDNCVEEKNINTIKPPTLPPLSGNELLLNEIRNGVKLKKVPKEEINNKIRTDNESKNDINFILKAGLESRRKYLLEDEDEEW
uniref:Probable clathrin heavy chain 1 (inferred by orthology to a C. elegans protein) n=1 Tax=Strongyloides venezuelensis TaxID=75913 RepID=A0A0K0FVH8_STRVS